MTYMATYIITQFASLQFASGIREPHFNLFYLIFKPIICRKVRSNLINILSKNLVLYILKIIFKVNSCLYIDRSSSFIVSRNLKYKLYNKVIANVQRHQSMARATWFVLFPEWE